MITDELPVIWAINSYLSNHDLFWQLVQEYRVATYAQSYAIKLIFIIQSRNQTFTLVQSNLFSNCRQKHRMVSVAKGGAWLFDDCTLHNVFRQIKWKLKMDLHLQKLPIKDEYFCDDCISVWWYTEVYSELSLRMESFLKIINAYFCKMLYLRCLAGFWIRIRWRLNFSETVTQNLKQSECIWEDASLMRK